MDRDRAGAAARLGSVLGRTHETGRSLAGTAGPALAHTQWTVFELAQSTGLSTLRARSRSRVLAEVAAETGTQECHGEGLRDQSRHRENVSAGRATTPSPRWAQRGTTSRWRGSRVWLTQGDRLAEPEWGALARRQLRPREPEAPLFSASPAKALRRHAPCSSGRWSWVRTTRSLRSARGELRRRAPVWVEPRSEPVERHDHAGGTHEFRRQG